MPKTYRYPRDSHALLAFGSQGTLAAARRQAPPLAEKIDRFHLPPDRLDIRTERLPTPWIRPEDGEWRA